ncbi:MAG: hypothetical protein AAFZ65_02995 [Planctomycetota bacterium]
MRATCLTLAGLAFVSTPARADFDDYDWTLVGCTTLLNGVLHVEEGPCPGGPGPADYSSASAVIPTEGSFTVDMTCFTNDVCCQNLVIEVGGEQVWSKTGGFDSIVCGGTEQIAFGVQAGDVVEFIAFNSDPFGFTTWADFTNLSFSPAGPSLEPTSCGHQDLTAAGTEANDRYGSSVALFGDLALVGAPGDDDAAIAGGAAYVLRNGASGWLEMAKLTSSDASIVQSFGEAVSLSATHALVGTCAPSSPTFGSGAAYVFERFGSAWTETAKLEPIGGDAQWLFGCAVQLHGDLAVVGAAGKHDSAGGLYVYERLGPAWVETAVLAAADGEPHDALGASVSASDSLLAAGAAGDDDVGADSGAVYLFERQGATWVESAKLVAGGGSAGDAFGADLALTPDLLVAGAPGSNGGTGAAHVFERRATGWVRTAVLTAADGQAGDAFGASVAANGDRVLIGAAGDSPLAAGSGSAYLFERTPGGWLQTARYVAEDGGPGDAFAGAVALFGGTGLVGAAGVNGPEADSGAAYALSLQGLCSGPDVVSLNAGGPHNFALFAGAANGGRIYLLLGSASGTQPGLVAGDLTLPLNSRDVYFDFTLQGANTGPLQATFGVLGPDGTATAALDLPPGLSPTLAGLVLHHAFVVFDSAGLPVFASDANALLLAD